MCKSVLCWEKILNLSHNFLCYLQLQRRREKMKKCVTKNFVFQRSNQIENIKSDWGFFEIFSSIFRGWKKRIFDFKTSPLFFDGILIGWRFKSFLNLSQIRSQQCVKLFFVVHIRLKLKIFSSSFSSEKNWTKIFSLKMPRIIFLMNVKMRWCYFSIPSFSFFALSFGSTFVHPTVEKSRRQWNCFEPSELKLHKLNTFRCQNWISFKNRDIM